MKKLITSILLLAMILTACTSNDNNANGDNGNGTSGGVDNSQTDEGTLGDTDGNGNVESNGDSFMNSDSETSNENSGSESSNENSDAGTFEAVTEVTSADDAVNFIGANVYSICNDVIPMMTETRVLSKEDLESVTFNTGLTDISGIKDIILSESMVGSFAYSLVMLRTDGKNTDEIAETLGNNINPAKWVCVSAESISSITLDDDIILVMGDTEQVDTIMNAVVEASNGIYNNIGSVVKVLG